MTTASDIRAFLEEALSTGRPIRFRYPGSDYFSARVEQVGSTWVEVYAYDSTSGKYGERWLKIGLLRDVEWSQSEAITFPKPPSTPSTSGWNLIPLESVAACG